jgi:hypothetical protein
LADERKKRESATEKSELMHELAHTEEQSEAGCVSPEPTKMLPVKISCSEMHVPAFH